jgi:hypothetical protein
MDISVKIFSALALILCTTVFFAGCASNSGTANTTATTTSTPSVTTATGALYTSGDIVKSPSGSAGTAWLVLSYDSATDSYTRAFVYQNADGTWGYRVNSNTETAARNVMDKVYSVKVTHVSVSSVPVKTPTAASTLAQATVTTGSGTVTTSATTATTTTPTGQPHFSSMTPDSADAGTTVSITDLVGSNFQSGASVMLARTGSTNITATNVVVGSSSHMTCTFVVPSTAATGSWDVIITNPDGQSVTYSNYFSIHASTSVTATTTTSASNATITITMVDPNNVNLGNAANRIQLTIYTSTNVQIGVTAKLVNGLNPDINGGSVYFPTAALTSMQVPFDIPAGSRGTWNLVLINPDGTTGTLTNALTIN